MGISKTDVPNNMLGKFSMTRGKKKRSQLLTSDIGQKSPEATVYSITDLPSLPKATPKLKTLLLSFNQRSIHEGSRRRRKKKFSKINAFFAFRSFYSHCIATAEHQRELSLRLSSVWNEEIDKDVWRKYADEYNQSKRNCSFNEWLCQANEKEEIKPFEILSIINVEDVFIGR